MRKILILLTLAILSQSTVFASISDNFSEERGYINVYSEKTEEVSANIAEITFIKENTGKKVDEVSKQNKDSVSKIEKALSEYKNDQTTVKTSGYQVTPIYGNKSKGREIEGYKVLNSITVKTKNTDKLGKIIDSAINAGADRVTGLSFQHETSSLTCNKLIKEAAKEAYNTAKITAETSNQTILGIKNINVSCSTQNNNSARFVNYAKNAVMSTASGAADTEAADDSTIIEAGTSKIRASVSASYYIK